MTDAKSLLEGCETCPDGKYCRKGTAFGQGKTCLAGYYCAAGTTSIIGATSATHSPCPPGFFSGPGASSCTTCAGVAYCPLATPSTDGTIGTIPPPPPGVDITSKWAYLSRGSKCLQGYYSVNGICTNCPRGHFCPRGTFQPRQCPVQQFPTCLFTY